MRACNGHCKGPLTTRWHYEAVSDPVTGIRVVLHDAKRCPDRMDHLFRKIVKAKGL